MAFPTVFNGLFVLLIFIKNIRVNVDDVRTFETTLISFSKLMECTTESAGPLVKDRVAKMSEIELRNTVESAGLTHTDCTENGDNEELRDRAVKALQQSEHQAVRTFFNKCISLEEASFEWYCRHMSEEIEVGI